MSEHSVSPAGDRPGVIVVDDEPEMRQEALTGLRDEGFACWAAPSVATALALLAEQGARVGVVVTDIRMPGESGLELVRRLQGRVPIREVVMITGHATPAEQALAGELGVREFLRKPFRLDELIAAIERAGRRVAAARGAPPGGR